MVYPSWMAPPAPFPHAWDNLYFIFCVCRHFLHMDPPAMGLMTPVLIWEHNITAAYR